MATQGHHKKLITPKGASLLTRVSELIDPVTGNWDQQLIYDTFWQEEVDTILHIPIDGEMEDWSAQHFNDKGLFSVKSAYKVAVARREAFAGRDASSSSTEGQKEGEFEWRKIWQLQVPNKVKMFLW